MLSITYSGDFPGGPVVENPPSNAGDVGLVEKGTTEDEMAGWHHRLVGHEFE